MPEKTSAEVVIDGKVYTLSGYEEEEYLQKVATYINNKLNEINAIEEFRRFPADMKATMLHLNIADDYFKAKAQVEKLEQEREKKEHEIYNLKHELVTCQIKTENDAKIIQQLEKDNEELLTENIRLETLLKPTYKDFVLEKVSASKTHSEKQKNEKDSHQIDAETDVPQKEQLGKETNLEKIQEPQDEKIVTTETAVLNPKILDTEILDTDSVNLDKIFATDSASTKEQDISSQTDFIPATLSSDEETS